jgi:hypothetical protein
MKYTLLILVALFLNTLCYSQIVTYAYDNSGNRTSRTLTVSKGLLSESDSSKINTEKITEQVGEQSIVVYPNPVREEVNVELTGYDENLDGSITIIDQAGNISSKVLLPYKRSPGQHNTYFRHDKCTTF